MSELSRPRPTRVLVTLTGVAAVVATVLFLDDSVSSDPAAETTPAPRVSAEQFCAAFEEVNLAHGANLRSPTPETTQRLKDAASGLAELLDGAEMSDDAEAGARFIIRMIQELDEVATSGEINTFDEQATLQDTANAKALGEYVADSCVPPAPTNPK